MRFRNAPEECNWLCDVLENLRNHSLEGTEEWEKYLRRFGKLLHDRGDDDGSICLQEHWAFYFGNIGDVASACRRRIRAIALLLELFSHGGAVSDVNAEYLLVQLERLAGELRSLADDVRLAATRKLIEIVKQSKANIDSGRCVPVLPQALSDRKICS